MALLTTFVAMSAAAAANPKTGYAPINGLRIYYEIHGAATSGVPPLVLLHGGGDTIGTSFARLLPELAKHRQVIAFEQQGYGRTRDVADRPFSFEQSADDTAALLDHLHIPQADILGFSNGGTIALQLAIRHPKVVRRLVLISAFYSREGAEPAFWAGFEHATFESMPQELKDAYLAVTPDPAGLRTMFEKAVNRMRNFKDIPDDAMRSITAPALVICADHDVERPEHAVAAFRLLPHAQLLIVPNATHMDVTSRTDVLVPAVDTLLR